jgi:formate-dependent nitrite reductase membrane component NrfD
MTGSDVRDDPTTPPGREAITGSAARRKRRRGRGRGEKAMVPDAEFGSYYGKPILNKPTWAATDIAGYLFLGGLAGASSVVAAGADLTGRDKLAGAAKTGALVAISGSLVALVHDLGRPSRFLNMLRVFKPSSPMSVGSWLLSAYGPAAGVAAVASLTGWFPRTGRAATVGAAALGPAVAAYTGVLIADTAVPAWHEGFRQLPFVFVGSAASAAGGLGMLAAPVAQAGPARRAVLFGAGLELAAVRRMEQQMGTTAEPLRTGKAGKLMRSAELLTLGGALVGGLLGRRSRLAAAVGGAASLAGSACTRFGIFQAGVASAEDPKYTVRPQRERLGKA